MVKCPLCNFNLDYDEDELDEGDELTCDECGEMIRVSGTSPLELERCADDDDGDEDFDDDEDEDDDYAEDDDEDGYEEDDDDDEEW